MGWRTPMPWDRAPHAGFSATTPWLPQSTDAASRNVDVENADPSSVLNLYRRLIAVRRAYPALVSSGYRRVEAAGDLLLIERGQGIGRILIALNLGSDPTHVTLLGARIVLLPDTPEREGQAVAGRIEPPAATVLRFA